MFNEEEFIEEFKKQNDTIKADPEFRNRLSAMVEAEASAKVIPFYKDVRKMGTIAAALAVLVIGGSVLGTGMLSDTTTKESVSLEAGTVNGVESEDALDSDLSSGATGTYQFDAQKVDISAVVQEIKDGAEVSNGDYILDQEEADALADKLSTGNVIETAADEDVIETYIISGSSTWCVDEYVTDDLYIYVK